MCFACGLENPVGLRLSFYSTGEAEVQAETVVPDHFQGYPGVAHGGIVAALLDEAAGRTVMAADPNHFTVTARLDVRYRQPVPVGRPVRLIAWRTMDRGRFAGAHAELRLPDGSVGAEAEALLVDTELQSERPEELGWRVVPDDAARAEAGT
jgi:acyl-coenzyme A thioesterase PaaI-like protein